MNRTLLLNTKCQHAALIRKHEGLTWIPGVGRSCSNLSGVSALLCMSLTRHHPGGPPPRPPPLSSSVSPSRPIWQLHIGRTVVQRQGCLETGALPDLHLRQRPRAVRRRDLRGHVRLRGPHHPRRRVLPHLPRCRRYPNSLYFTHLRILVLWRHLAPLGGPHRTWGPEAG